MLIRLVIVSLVISVAMASGDGHRHGNLHRAREHHSSMVSAQHADGHRTNRWIVATDDIDAVVRTLNAHLTLSGGARVQVERRSPLPVVTVPVDTNHDHLSALLMAEQRAGTLEWFHRERVSERKGH